MQKFKNTPPITLTLTLILSLLLSLSLSAQDGKVGIGTTNPQAKLHIAGDLQVEDLSGEGDRTLVATPEGKLKAVTNDTEPAPSNPDTLRAKFIELIDDEGDTRFILNAHTGQFQMLDDDTLWYELEVNSPPNETIRLDNSNGPAGEEIENTLTPAGIQTVEQLKTFLDEEIEDFGGQDEEEVKCLLKIKKLLNEDQATQIKKSFQSGPIVSPIAPPNTFTTTTLTTSGSNGVNNIRIFTETDALDINDPSTFIHSVSVSGKCQCSLGKEEIPPLSPEFIEFLATQNKSPGFNSVSIFEKDPNDILTKSSSFSTSLNTATQKIQQTFTDFSNALNNIQTAGESTITNTETGGSVSSKIDENGTPEFTIGVGGQLVKLDPEEVSITKDGNTEQASIEQVVNSAQNFESKNQEQDSQINENKDNISNLDDRVTEVENNSSGGGSGETTAPKFTASENGSTNELKPEKTEINSVDGSKAEFSKDGITITSPDGDELVIDCEGVSKLDDDDKKQSGFAGIGFNTTDGKIVVHVDLEVFGSITELGKKVTKIDHPDDPNNQYLQHSYIGTNELLNEYSGNTTTNAQGKATVQLPDYVESLNTDFRYQLTVIGSFAQAIVAQKVQNNQFVIRTNEPNVEVSWEIKGVRNDIYAQQNPLEVETPKENTQKGTTLYDATAKAFTPTLNRKAALQQQATETADVE